MVLRLLLSSFIIILLGLLSLEFLLPKTYVTYWNIDIFTQYLGSLWVDSPTDFKNTFLRRKLSATIDYATGQSLATINGVVSQVNCPIGTYRPAGSTRLIMITGQRQDGCVPCPRGRYGSTTGLKTPQCSGPCPVGKYGSNVGLTSVLDCQLCPPGRYGASTGLTGATCSTTSCCTACAAGKYSDAEGATSVGTCLNCPPGYRGWGCIWAVQPRTGRDQDHQQGELRNGKYTVGSSVVNGLGLTTDPIPIK